MKSNIKIGVRGNGFSGGISDTETPILGSEYDGITSEELWD